MGIAGSRSETQSYTTLSTWDLDVPLAALDSFADVSRASMEMTQVLADIVYFGLCFGQLNAGSLAVFELAC